MNKINYSQCWEDSLVLQRALTVSNEDTVLSITSGGDNTLFLLTFNPKEIVTIDMNPAQNNLLSIKMAAIKKLKYEDVLKFLGVTESKNRYTTFIPEIKDVLDDNVYQWCKHNQVDLNKGIIHSGKFERFINLSRKYFLRTIHSKKIISQFVSMDSIEEQRNFYRHVWCSRLWNLFFKLISSRFILRKMVRQKGAFHNLKEKNISNTYLERLDLNIETILIKDNPYTKYCLIGSTKDCLSSYLQKRNYDLIRTNTTTQIKIVTENILTYLKGMPDNYFTKFNLSDIFEFCSDSLFEDILIELLRTSKPNSRLVYWDNLMKRDIPIDLNKNIVREDDFSDNLFKEDKTFFYGRLHICKIVK